MHAQLSQIPPVLVPDVFGLKFLVGGEAAVLNEIQYSPETTAARSSMVASNISCHTPGAAATAFGLEHAGSTAMSPTVSVAACQQ